MNSKAALALLKLTGQLDTIVAVGRVETTGRFVPYAQTERIVTLKRALGTQVLHVVADFFRGGTPRHNAVITHCAVWVGDQWIVDSLGKRGFVMDCHEHRRVNVSVWLPKGEE